MFAKKDKKIENNNNSELDKALNGLEKIDCGDLKIGIAFGGGGVKSFAHVGIIEVFKALGIKPASIAGTSAGSLIAASYALGIEPEVMRESAKILTTKQFKKGTSFRLFGDSLINDKELNKAYRRALGVNTFEDTKIPFRAIAVDLESGKEFVIDKGLLWEAARASSAVPLLFSPFFVNGHYLVDGGLLNNVPVDHVNDVEKMDLIIGIEIGAMTSRQYISAMVWEKFYHKPKTLELYPSFWTRMKMNLNLMTHIMLRSIDIMTEKTLEERYLEIKPDILIKPDLSGISLLDFNLYEEAIRIGKEEAIKLAPRIKEVIELKLKEKHQLDK